MKILVTGKAGQVGHCLVRQLAQTQWQVQALDRSELDISDCVEVDRLVGDFKPDVIINAAAYTAVDKAEKDPKNAYGINCDGPEYLAGAAEAVGAALFHISTDYVFAGDKQGEYSESDPTCPQGVYGASKLAGEKAVSSTCTKYIVLRTAWVFGEHGNNFVKTMLRLAKSRDELNVVADQYGGPTYAGDIAKALIDMVVRLETKGDLEWGVYHFSGHPHLSWCKFAQAVFAVAVDNNVLGKAPVTNPIATSEYPTPAKRPGNSKLDCTKIKAVMNISPSDWQAALENIEAYAGIE